MSDDGLLIELAIYGVMFLVGGPLAIWRWRRDKGRQGRLSVHDGQTLSRPADEPASRSTYVTAREGTPQGLRVTVSGLAISQHIGFRLEGKTERTASGLWGRLIVEGTKKSTRAERLFARSDVVEAVSVVCGASCSFNRIDLFPDGGDLAVVVKNGVGDVDDLCERLLRFAEVLDRAIPSLDDDGVDLGATSGTASSAAFSIEIRS